MKVKLLPVKKYLFAIHSGANEILWDCQKILQSLKLNFFFDFF